MAKDTRIEWADHTANLVFGCTKVRNNPLCDNCYAATFARRLGNDVWGDDKPRRVVKSVWENLDKWQQAAAEAGERKRVFTMSMGDIFERGRPLVDHNGRHVGGSTAELRDRLFRNINRDMYDNLDFLMLTKRPQNIMRMVPKAWHADWPGNVWVGTSVGDQANVERNIPSLLAVAAPVRFLSMEPLLESVDVSKHLRGLSWVIVGGESGHGARPMLPAWAVDVKRQCAAARVPFFFKQGSQANWRDFKNPESFPSELQCREYPKVGTNHSFELPSKPVQMSLLEMA